MARKKLAEAETKKNALLTVEGNEITKIEHTGRRFQCADCLTDGGSLWWTIGGGKKQVILCQKCFKKRREAKKK